MSLFGQASKESSFGQPVHNTGFAQCQDRNNHYCPTTKLEEKIESLERDIRELRDKEKLTEHFMNNNEITIAKLQEEISTLKVKEKVLHEIIIRILSKN